MSKRPAAHNPMIYRKVKRPDGTHCQRPGCAGFVRVGTVCQICVADTDLGTIQALGIGYPEEK